MVVAIFFVHGYFDRLSTSFAETTERSLFLTVFSVKRSETLAPALRARRSAGVRAVRVQKSL